MSVIIRRSEPKDAHGLQALFSGVDAYSQTLQLPNPSIATWEHRMNHVPGNVHSFVAVLDDEIVGNLGLEHKTNVRLRHSATFGMAVKDGHHGKGIGSALLATAIDLAENWLGVTRIELTVYTDNTKAITLYQKFGFEIEGEAKKFAFRNGEFVNAYYMARVKN